MKDKQNIVRVGMIVAGALLLVAGMATVASRAFRELLLRLAFIVNSPESAQFWRDRAHWLGLEAAISGILLISFGWQFSSILQFFGDAQVKNNSRLKWAAILLLAVLWIPIIIMAHSAEIENQRYWWLGDDAMISMRYAQNLADGEGLVWNPGERVEGYTNFLWTVIMAGVHLLPVDAAHTSMVVLMINLILAVLAIPLIIGIVSELDGDTVTTAAALVLYILNQNLMYWTTNGFETTLLTLLLLAGIYRTLKEAQNGKPTLITFVIFGAIALVRADGLILAGLGMGLALLINKKRIEVILFSLGALILPAGHFLFRYLYYGDLLPNTAYLKAMNWDGKYLAGLSYLATFAKTYLPMILLALYAALKGRERQRSILAVVLLYCGYIAAIGGDVFPHFRFFTPIIPLLGILAMDGLSKLAPSPGLKGMLFALVFLFVPMISPGYSGALYPRESDLGNVKIGLWLKENTPAEARVADFWAGSVFYFSERYAIDLLGKSDKYIAREPAVSASLLPGHNKFDFDYSLGACRPDYVVASFKLPVDMAVLERNAAAGFAFSQMLFLNETFRQDYLDNPLQACTWRTIFARNGARRSGTDVEVDLNRTEQILGKQDKDSRMISKGF